MREFLDKIWIFAPVCLKNDVLHVELQTLLSIKTMCSHFPETPGKHATFSAQISFMNN